jgi:hypothetical protein
MTVIAIESLVRPFQDEVSYPTPYYPQGQRAPQNIKMKFGGGNGGVKTLGTAESGSVSVYCEAHQVEKEIEGD